MTPEQADKILQAQISRNEKNILAAIKKLENRIIELTSTIDTRIDGSIVGPSRSLAQTRSVLKQTRAAFAEIYGAAVNDALNSYSQVDALVQESLGIAYQGVTVDSLNALSSLDRSYGESLSNQTQDKLSAVFIDHAITGKDKDSLINSISGVLTGGIDGAGRSMSTHASTIAQDGMMTYYQAANNAVAKQAGIDKFKYYGSLINDSRDWCVDHVGKTYTKAEIDAFDNDSWAGKKAGSTMLNRGGYNCRHSWLPIVE